MSVGSQSEGQLSCCDVRAVSHLSVVQDLRDVARDRSFKHVFLGVGVTKFVTQGCCTFAAVREVTQCPIKSDELNDNVGQKTLGTPRPHDET